MLNPYGTAEVMFQFLAARPPFDSVALREEPRRRLNVVPEINLPEEALSRRPAFSLDVLTSTAALEQVAGTLRWVLATAGEHGQ